MDIVVYTQRVEVIESYNERRDCADQRIPEFIDACGYTPIPLPNNAALVEKIVNSLKPVGIILTGGNSLEKYGGNAPERDLTDCFLISKAVRESIPLYGFCRGMQSILDYFGSELKNVEGHVAVRHFISGRDNKREVNSYHNQACLSTVMNDLEIVMRSDDGVVEKIVHKSLPIIGTMWHPEREAPFNDADIKMVKELFGGDEK